MGLKMPGDDEVLANKIFLNRANVRSKAKSWLKASTGEETEATLTSQSKINDETVDNELTAIIVGDELSGIGVPLKAGSDDPSNRQLMSANEALRRKLLSKDAYKRYSEEKANGAEKVRPKSKKIGLEEEPQEEKGKSSRQDESSPQFPGTSTVDTKTGLPAVSKQASKNKKRPSSYLDQLLADRQTKQQKKAKRKANDD